MNTERDEYFAPGAGDQEQAELGLAEQYSKLFRQIFEDQKELTKEIEHEMAR